MAQQPNMDDSMLFDEVLQLTLSVQRGEATEEERARLERLLSDNPQAVVLYLQISEDTLTLREAAEAKANGASEQLVAVTQSTKSSQYRNPLERWSEFASRIPKSMLGLTAAVSIVLALAGSAWMIAPWESTMVSPLLGGGDSARVVNTSNVQWSEGAQRYSPWSFVAPGEFLKFEEGVVGLFLANGVELHIEGPADVQFVSLYKVIAREGKLAARVGPDAKGFRIETPHAKVIDRGTSFGLSVEGKHRTAVVVYEGIVDLDVLGGQSHPRRRLETGEALSVDDKGELRRITTVENSKFLPPPEVRSPDAQNRLIMSVSDNIRSLETTKYYRVIPRGFREDCRAYVDREHEWNGLDERGLPSFLVGGDYVMTFNDDKIVTEIEIAIGVSRPSIVYLLVDDRVPPPDWLKRDFVDTNWDVGSDEGYPDRVIDTVVGAGQSIDHICSVWRREVPEADTVVLGALSQEKSTMPAEDVERSMYGIIVTPLRD